MASNPAWPSDPNASTWDWDPTTAAPLTTRPLNPVAPPTQPTSPRTTGGGAPTVVNTGALTTFANNIDQLITPVKTAQGKVFSMKPVAAGAFDKAWAISDAVTGGSSAGTSKATPLKESMNQALIDLANGLGDLRDAVRHMATIYTTTDQLNGMNVADLQKALDKPAGDFSGLVGGGSSN